MHAFGFLLKVKVKVRTLDIVPLTEKLNSEVLWYGSHCQWISQFYRHTQAFIHEWNELRLLLSFLPKLVCIY